ncbi:hypothetical protein CEUSTIGMA_g115.t1 [Chlamydomonas eustigma]|uniref:Uncharacterized protein n=1 Tax=Chlamydomonas eustigma TaxID=1157962 RepID=A0A250WPN7_9CHLO|nr:hypothetical protein CEUSTIGMA_g115.t1 [Chlamydomonas eustigma]|eukprot:GAX72659.1 hypothetical protein CEUSTIGMA_g115.t1 [Chlamydomonas eustigma]
MATLRARQSSSVSCRHAYNPILLAVGPQLQSRLDEGRNRGLIAHTDPFGNFHWNPSDLTVGLLFFIPSLAVDAIFMLPDYSSTPDQAKDTMRLFIKPELLQRLQDAQRRITSEVESKHVQNSGTAGASSLLQSTETLPNTSTPKPNYEPLTMAPPGAASKDVHSEGMPKMGLPLDGPASPGNDSSKRNKMYAMGDAGDMYMSVSAIAEGAELGPVEAAGRKLRFALDMLQDYYMRNNPTASMLPVTDLIVILVACLADEMLYRAVLLTLVSYWIRDRLYEAGVEDLVILPQGLGSMDVLQAGQYSSLACGVIGGILAFTLRAWRESTLIEKAQELAKQATREQEQRPKALPGWEKPSSSPRQKEAVKKLPPDLVAEVAVQLSGSMSSLNSLVWRLEGVRELIQVAASGAAFISTGNLLAPYVGSAVSQILLSTYQRRCLQRFTQKLEAAQEKALKEALAGLGKNTDRKDP